MGKHKGETATEPNGGTTTATAAPPVRQPQAGKPEHAPQYKVILHNDDVNTFEHVIATILQLTPLTENDAILRTIEAHRTGCALLLITHKERAELYVEQFQSASLTVTIESAE